MVTITVNEKKKGAREFLDFIKHLPYVKVYDAENKKPNARTRKALRNIEKGKVYSTDNVEDLFKKLNL